MANKKEIAILLHNIRSVYNVGSIFRTADALGIDKIYLSGFTPTPLDRFGRYRKDLSKVALGAEKNVSWQYVKDPKRLIEKLNPPLLKLQRVKERYQIIALEQNKNSIDYKKVKIKSKVLFVVGNEVEGVSEKILRMCDVVAEIPMKGKKESLNVSVALAVALFCIIYK